MWRDGLKRLSRTQPPKTLLGLISRISPAPAPCKQGNPVFTYAVRSSSYECQKSHHQGSKCSSFILASQPSPIAGHPCRKPISSSQSAPTGWCWVESASDTMGGEGNREIILEDYKVELENGGEAWEGMG